MAATSRGLGLSVLLVPPVIAAELAGVELADQVEVGGETLALNGVGMRKKIGFKVYVGGLYLGEKSSDAGAILAADAPRRTDMVFMRKVSAKQLCGAWSDCLEANNPAAPDDVSAGFDRLCGMMTDVAKGDHLVTTYVPGEGSTIAIMRSGEDTPEDEGVIAGKGFADALFACWIGDKPATADLKSGMLGR